MPVTKTVSGLIYFSEMDDLGGWVVYGDSVIDTAVKVSGSGSSRSSDPYPDPYSLLRDDTFYVGPTGSKKVRFWHKHVINATSGGLYPVTIFGASTWYINDTWATQDWHQHKETYTASGTLIVFVNQIMISSGAGTPNQSWIDRLVFARSSTLTISGLVEGQKVELFRASDDALLGTQTCAAGQTTVSFNIDAEDYPLQLYCQVYAIDGSTLIDITPPYEMCGGDTWQWSCVGGTLKVETDELVIYRQAATGTPKTATLTATLRKLTGEPYAGATIYFTTTLGDLSAGSATTNVDGEASVTLTGTIHGIAVIEAKWLGDLIVPAAAGYIVVHVFYEAEAGDSDKPFQFFCEGIEYAFIAGTGRYAVNEEGATEDFEVQLSSWPDTLTVNGIVSIYRKGVKEYSGLFSAHTRALSDPKLTIGGPDVSGLLDNRIVTLVTYTAKTAQYIIADLLEGYPSGIAEGVLDNCPTILTMSFDNEFLREAIQRVVDAVGWKVRVKIDRTLDFAENFTGGQSGATFTEGDNLLDLVPDVNYRRVFNAVRMRGNGVTSLKQDGTKIKEQGLREVPVFQKSISSQATLDAACQGYLNMKKTGEEVLNAIVKDTYDVGAFACEDQVYIDSPTLSIQGWRTVKRIERSMSDANIAIFDLTNRAKDYWEIDRAYRRMVKDASV